MATMMYDHDRINETHGYVAGLLVAMKAVIDALEAVRDSNPEVADRLTEPLQRARLALLTGEKEGEKAAAVGRARWDALPSASKRSDH